jgi:hypothetical protein
MFSFYFYGRSLFSGRGLFGEGSGDVVDRYGFSG